MTADQELFEIAKTLEATAETGETTEFTKPLQALQEAANDVERSFSGSWLGYHSRIYYTGLKPAPPGAHFSQEWGTKEFYTDLGSRGDWREFDPQGVKEYIREQAGHPDLQPAKDAAERADRVFSESKSEIVSILSNENERGEDTFLEKLKTEIDGVRPLSPSDIAQIWAPKGQIITRDMVAAGQGTQVPPHVAVQVEVASIEHTFGICKKAANLARQAASHIQRKGRRRRTDERIGTNVFIGHGRSSAWRELKDFVADRLGLPWDEFNRVPVAGVTNIARLAEMLDAAAIALIIMTAEDEMADGELQARMNVIHEVGLFQGRLGFTKAIVLFEEGCREFTNIQGLGQIRFPAGRISAVFEEVRRVLEREGLLGE